MGAALLVPIGFADGCIGKKYWTATSKPNEDRAGIE
jgi:hypothetical protein